MEGGPQSTPFKEVRQSYFGSLLLDSNTFREKYPLAHFERRWGRPKSFDHLEKRSTVREMGSPTQKMWIITPIIIMRRENGRLAAAESGTTIKFIKK